MKKIKINIIIFCIAIMAIPVFLILFFKQQSAICLLIGAFVLGYVIVELIRFINCNNNLDKSDLIMFLLTLLLAFIPTIISFLNPPFSEQLNRLYFPKDSIDFENEFVNPITSNLKLPKLIFAFDNSEAGLRKDKIASDLQNRFRDYCKDIEDLYPESSIDNRKEIVKRFYECNNYGNFLKARLCFELIKNKGKDGEFIVVKIGNPASPYNKDNGFKKLEEKNLQEEIYKIIQTENKEVHTDFDAFNDRLEEYTEKTETELSEYVLYAYSDFYHDYEGEIETETQKNNIIKRRKGLLSNIVQNYFIDNHKRQNGVFILDTIKPAFPYENHFFIGKIDENEAIVPIRIVEKKEHWFYSKVDNENIITAFRLIFNKCDKKIRSYNENYTEPKHRELFSINNIEIGNKEWKIFNSDNTIIRLKYEGYEEPRDKPVIFEIEHNEIHYFVYFEFIKEWDKWLKWFLPLCFVALGLFVGFFEFKQ